MDNLDIYKDSSIILDRAIPSKIISWITILIALILLFIVFSFLPFNIYKSMIGEVNIVDNDSYIILSQEYSDFPVNINNKLYIKDKKYNYEVVKIEEDKTIIKVDIEDDLKIQNNIVIINILKNRTTLFKIIKNKIKKGFDL